MLASSKIFLLVPQRADLERFCTCYSARWIAKILTGIAIRPQLIYLCELTSSQRKLELLFLLSPSSRREATLERDKVFVLLGLVDHLMELLLADNTKLLNEVFRDAACSSCATIKFSMSYQRLIIMLRSAS
jgi:hypothetical protein